MWARKPSVVLTLLSPLGSPAPCYLTYATRSDTRSVPGTDRCVGIRGMRNVGWRHALPRSRGNLEVWRAWSTAATTCEHALTGADGRVPRVVISS